MAGVKQAYNEAVKNAFHLHVSLAAMLTISGIFVKDVFVKEEQAMKISSVAMPCVNSATVEYQYDTETWCNDGESD